MGTEFSSLAQEIIDDLSQYVGREWTQEDMEQIAVKTFTTLFVGPLLTLEEKAAILGIVAQLKQQALENVQNEQR